MRGLGGWLLPGRFPCAGARCGFTLFSRCDIYDAGLVKGLAGVSILENRKKL